MSEMDLRQMIESASGWAEKQFARKGEVLPMWHAMKSNGEHIIIPAPPTDKDTSATIMRALFELHDVVRCLFIDEAWVFDGVGKGHEENERVMKWIKEHDGISGFPGRVEVVTFAGEDEAAGSMQAHRRIIRGQGKPRLAPLAYLDMTGVRSEGRLVGMLPRRRDAKVQ